jgi:allophanate hydrolase subunit 2
MASALVGQDLNRPLIEILQGTFEFSVDQPTLVAVHGGGPVSYVNGIKSTVNQNIILFPGNTFTIERGPHDRSQGPHYLGIRGLQVESTLGSTSSDTLSGLGPTPLQAGIALAVVKEELYVLEQLLGLFTSKNDDASIRILRFIPGPHVHTITNQLWEVTNSSRSGLRLFGAPISGAEASLASMPMLPGAIQIPSSGQPIILGPDSGVTGGYPVAGVIATVDLPLLSRLSQKDVIEFEQITVSTAKELLRNRTSVLSERLNFLKLPS